MTTFLVDVSDSQGVIDWPTVARSGISAAVARCVTEPGSVDATYARNVAGQRDAGLIPGAYCFLTGGIAAHQADLFLRTVGDPAGMLIMVDAERPNYHATPTPADVRLFVAAWRKAHPSHPILVYGSPGGPLGSMGKLADLGPLWMAAYPSTAIAPLADLYARAGGAKSAWWAKAFGGWKSPTIWQFASTGRVPGISRNVDLSAIETADLRALAGIAPAKPTTPDVIYAHGGKPTGRGTYVVLDGGADVRSIPDITGTKLARLLPGTRWYVWQTSEQASGRWCGDATGGQWIQSSHLKLAA